MFTGSRGVYSGGTRVPTRVVFVGYFTLKVTEYLSEYVL